MYQKAKLVYNTLMNNFELVPFDLTRSGSLRPAYAQTHVIQGEVPLSAITFGPEMDDIAQYTGPRDADSCPAGRENLVARPTEPAITNQGETQHLRVECPQQVRVGYRHESFPVCSLKAAVAKLPLDAIPAEVLTSRFNDPRHPDIACPFMFLGAMVASNGVEVFVHVDVEVPADKYTALLPAE